MRNFPIHINDAGEEITIISGQSVGTNNQSYNLARGFLQIIEFIEKTAH